MSSKVPLGEVAKFINGRAFKPTEWVSNGLPIIRIQNLTNEDAAFNYYDKEVEEKYYVKDGDLLISWSATLDVFIWNRGNAILNQHIFKAVSDTSKISKMFLFYALKYVMDELRAQTHGATMKHITRKPFEQTKITLPPLPEQERIVHLLDEAEQVRKLRGQASARMEEFVPALFYEMFGDPAKNTKNWKVQPFGEICESRLGKMLDEKQQSGLYLRPYLRNQNVQWGEIDISNMAQMDFDERDREVFRLQEGDLLICEGGEVGRTAIWHSELPECYFQKAIHRARPNLDIAIPEFILWTMYALSRTGGFDDFTSQSTIAHLTGVKLKTLPIPLPPLDLQREFARRVSEARAVQSVQRRSEERVEALYQSMLARAFGGEL